MTAIDELVCGECLEWLRAQPEKSVDLVFASPPYEDLRTYDIDFHLRGEEWVAWMVEVVQESLRVCRGLVAFVVEGKTEDFRWSATPALLIADLYRVGVNLRKPSIYKRNGIPGSGGPDWLRNDWEFIICATPGRLPWSDNTAMGHSPTFGTGGRCSNRTRDGQRSNQKRYGALDRTPSESQRRNGEKGPEIANPGNVIDCGTVGGGHMGDDIAHENEAPFPEKLPEFFVRSFCPPGGIVLDPFCGSGTTCKVAKVCGRHYIGVDIRESQIELSRRRLAEVQTFLF